MVRCAFELPNGTLMQYELFVPTGHDKSVPTPFVVSISGSGQRHVNHFSRRLVSEHWVLAVPLRPDSSRLLFEGKGSPGDGIWHLHEFCRHLRVEFAVSGDGFVMAGVSNGGSTVLRFATLWPTLCHGLVIVTGSIQGLVEGPAPLLRGIPIDMYCGTADECGFYKPMLCLASELREAGQVPPATFTVFDGAGHCCSPLIDGHLLHGKIWLMMVHAASCGRRCLELAVPDRARKPAEEVLSQLAAYSEALGLRYSRLDGKLVVANKTEVSLGALLVAPMAAPEPESPSAPGFAAGSPAEVWSNTKRAWVQCTVKSVSQEGVEVIFGGSAGTQLSKTVPLQQVHALLRKLDATPDSSPVSVQEPESCAPGFAAGGAAEVWSNTKRGWVRCTVKCVSQEGVEVWFGGDAGTQFSKTIPLQQVSALLRKVEDDSPDSAPSTPRPSTGAFAVGDCVDIWSGSKQTWFEDGRVVEVEPSRLKVAFAGGSLSKWVLVEQLELLLRQRAGLGEPARGPSAN